MTRHWHPTLERIVRWLKPSAGSFAAAAAVYGPDLTLQLAATPGAVEGPPSPGCDGRSRSGAEALKGDEAPQRFDCAEGEAANEEAVDARACAAGREEGGEHAMPLLQSIGQRHRRDRGCAEDRQAASRTRSCFSTALLPL